MRPSTSFWAIDRTYLPQARMIVRGEALSSPRADTPQMRSAGRVAIVPIVGVMTHKPSHWTVSTQAIAQLITSAAAESRFSAILLDVDSPGGEVSGTPELAAVVRAARSRKRVVAQVNSLAASAAYWVASQASEIVATPSGDVGSIGVFAVHWDISTALERDGVKVTVVKAGDYKAEGSPYERLTEVARLSMQERVDGYHSDFIRDVALGRGVSESMVRTSFGRGRLLHARSAQSVRAIDRVGTIDDTIRQLGMKTELLADDTTRRRMRLEAKASRFASTSSDCARRRRLEQIEQQLRMS